MKKPKFFLILMVTVFLVISYQSPAKAFYLPTWELNINGDFLTLNGLDQSGLTNYLGQVGYASSIDLSGFDLTSNLGQILITTSPGYTGNYYISGFFDYDFNTESYSEDGRSVGSPVFGQSWELNNIDYNNLDPGIYANFLNGQLGNANGIREPGDIAMALGWTLNLSNGETATIRLVVSETAPESDFYLMQTDSDGNIIYYSGGVAAVPEPTTLLLLGSGLVALAGIGRKRIHLPGRNI